MGLQLVERRERENEESGAGGWLPELSPCRGRKGLKINKNGGAAVAPRRGLAAAALNKYLGFFLYG